MLTLVLFLFMLPIALPAFSLLVLTIAALQAHGKQAQAGKPAEQSSARVAVLVPAHNESSNVLPTIQCLQQQLGPTDRLLVIADNCNDDTAELARQAGAQVIERQNPDQRGKGYALAFGVDHLRRDPADVVMVVDADCLLSEGAVAAVAAQCHLIAKPVQMLYLIKTEKLSGLRLKVVEFAMLVKNLVRPLGTNRLGGACHLMGTGMAFPWALINKANLATGHIVEDMKLGIELAMAGHPAQFQSAFLVTSAFHADNSVVKVQKSRWEHGHLDVIKQELPTLAATAIKTRRPELIVLAMDLLIPPLAFYCAVLLVGTTLSLLAALAWPDWKPTAWLGISACIALLLAITLAWQRFGRHLLSAKELLMTPLYVIWKLPVYLAYFLRKKSGWVRTKRDSE